MRTTINLDDGLLEEAQRLTGLAEKTALVRAALEALIERESARRLARLGRSLRLAQTAEVLGLATPVGETRHT